MIANFSNPRIIIYNQLNKSSWITLSNLPIGSGMSSLINQMSKK